ncbi:MAG TPA: N-formylglutamate deformylase [Burkholderiales bacterium]|nr:N-formylglutamate deformylase [Burkholderiales bacterium]
MPAHAGNTFELKRGTAPLLISMPHAGTFLPAEIAGRLTDYALRLPDTDWHLERLYEFVDALGASVIVATHSRYTIDLNRPPDGANLYPGQDTTALCPVDTFDRQPLYREGQQPDAAEIQLRIERYWRPYHAALQGELGRLRERHARVVLWDAHSIRSAVPRFFAGRLPDLNFGSAAGRACDPRLAALLLETARQHPRYASVLDGRFKGGHITRHYGRPAQGVHAIQLELAQRAYMREDYPYSFDERLATALRPALIEMLDAALRWVRPGA